MVKFSDQRWARLAAAVVLVAALGLSACGRKGPLDPPPGASQYSSTQPAPAGSPGRQMSIGPDGKAMAPPPSGRREPFILDWLID